MHMTVKKEKIESKTKIRLYEWTDTTYYHTIKLKTISKSEMFVSAASIAKGQFFFLI